MTAYAIGLLHHVNRNAEIVQYLERIDGTLAPFAGRFLVHGATIDVLEGSWSGHPIVIEFPDWDAAQAWYRSPAYQAILGLRTRNASGEVLIASGVTHSHRATDILSPAVQ